MSPRIAAIEINRPVPKSTKLGVSGTGATGALEAVNTTESPGASAEPVGSNVAETAAFATNVEVVPSGNRKLKVVELRVKAKVAERNSSKVETSNNVSPGPMLSSVMSGSAPPDVSNVKTPEKKSESVSGKSSPSAKGPVKFAMWKSPMPAVS